MKMFYRRVATRPRNVYIIMHLNPIPKQESKMPAFVIRKSKWKLHRKIFFCVAISRPTVRHKLQNTEWKKFRLNKREKSFLFSAFRFIRHERNKKIYIYPAAVYCMWHFSIYVVVVDVVSSAIWLSGFTACQLDMSTIWGMRCDSVCNLMAANISDHKSFSEDFFFDFVKEPIPFSAATFNINISFNLRWTCFDANLWQSNVAHSYAYSE